MARGAKPASSLERVRQVNIVTTAEHKAAGFELRNLGVAAEPLAREAITGQGMPTGSLPLARAAADGPQANVPGPASAAPAKAKNLKSPRNAPESWTSTLFKGW